MIDIDKIKDSVSISDIIGKYIDIKKAGKNHIACCPFHGEKTPSFTISEDKQFYHCFGCGAHGDVVAFVMEYDRVDFLDAIKILGGDISLDKGNQPIKTYKTRLPLGGQPYSSEEITSFIKNKCEDIGGQYFYGRSHALVMTDIYKNMVSLFLDGGSNENIKFYGKFLHGSCFVFGDINVGETVMISQNYHLCKKIHQKTQQTIICFFVNTNLRFIANQVKKHKKVVVICDDEGSVNDADDLNLDYRRMSNV